MADQTDAGKADPRAVSAGKGDVRSGGRWRRCGRSSSDACLWMPLVYPPQIGQKLGRLCGAMYHGRQPGQTTICGKCYRC